MQPSREESVSDWGDGLGGREVNMADPQTLVDFAVWSMENYPADHYALILWNHGGGWRAEDDVRTPTMKDICWDDTTGGDDALMMKEVKDALADITSQQTALDLIGFDACLMGMVEVAYEIRNYGRVMVASAETEPGDGWPYNTILTDLVANPSMNAEDFGNTIVTRYGESYASWYGTTQSAIDLSQMDAFSDTLNSLADVMIEGDQSDIQAARSAVQAYYDPGHIDIGHFAELLSDAGDTDIATAAADLTSVFSDTVISEYHDRMNSDATGLAIYFPVRQALFDTDYNEDSLDFLMDTLWGDFLESYYVGDTSEVTLLSPEDGAVLSVNPAGISFSWQGDTEDRYKMQFMSGTLTYTFPENFWMPNTTTDTIPREITLKSWKRIVTMAERGGIVYWRVVARNSNTGTVETSDARNFTIEP
jgi:hypothetical protein